MLAITSILFLFFTFFLKPAKKTEARERENHTVIWWLKLNWNSSLTALV